MSPLTPHHCPDYAVQERLRDGALWLLFGQQMEMRQDGSWARGGSCWFGISGGPAVPVIPPSLSGDSHKEVQQGLGTHVYFMNDFRERGGKIIQNVIQAAVFFLLCFVAKQKKLPHLILTQVPWDCSD